MRAAFSNANLYSSGDEMFHVETLESRRMLSASVFTASGHGSPVGRAHAAVHAKAILTQKTPTASLFARPSLIQVGPPGPKANLKGFISGTVFDDSTNENGVQDAGEPGVGGHMVYLDVPGTGAYASGDPYTYTNASGYYSFSGLALKNYLVRVAQVSGTLVDSPVYDGDHYVQLSLQYSVINQNFGLVAKGFTAAALQGGKLLIANYSHPTGSGVESEGIRRYNPNGTVDTTFATAGLVNFITTMTGTITNITVLPNGNIVAVFSASGHSTLYLLSANGVVMKSAMVPNSDVVFQVAAQSDSKIVLSTQRYNTTLNDIIRFNADLALDTSFANTGVVPIPQSRGYTPTSVGILSNGEIRAVYSNATVLVVVLTSSGVIL